MARFVWILFLFSGLLISAFAQTTSPISTSPQSSDPQALAIAAKSILAMTNGVSVNDATLNASVTSITGADSKTGTGTFFARGMGQSRIDVSIGDDLQNEVRTTTNGYPSGQWKRNTSNVNNAAQHNCWTDASWFFPALSFLAQANNSNFIFSYLGQEPHNGLTTLHLRVVQTIPGDSPKLNLSRLSTTDYYLDPTSYLPLVVAFSTHSNNDANRDIPVEIRLADYQAINGVYTPFHIQELLNGTLDIDIVVQTAQINSGLAATQFTLQ